MAEMKTQQGAQLRAGGDLFGELPPITDDPDYPVILRELADQVRQQLVASGRPDGAAAIAESCAEHVREHFGGQMITWPKGDTMRLKRRRAAMWAAFNGTNHNELAKQFGLGVQQVYRQLKIARAEHRARTEHALFDDEGAPTAAAGRGAGLSM